MRKCFPDTNCWCTIRYKSCSKWKYLVFDVKNEHLMKYFYKIITKKNKMLNLRVAIKELDSQPGILPERPPCHRLLVYSRLFQTKRAKPAFLFKKWASYAKSICRLYWMPNDIHPSIHPPSIHPSIHPQISGSRMLKKWRKKMDGRSISMISIMSFQNVHTSIIFVMFCTDFSKKC